eukprot:15328981-Alexandrium_andersonii.AAC.1
MEKRSPRASRQGAALVFVSVHAGFWSKLTMAGDSPATASYNFRNWPALNASSSAPSKPWQSCKINRRVK